MAIIRSMFRRAAYSLRHFREWILHCTIFHRQLTGEVAFYGPDEPEVMDGYLVLRDLRFGRPAVYGYRFDNRYMLFATPQQRCAAVWRAILLHDAVRPLAVIEGDRAFTPYGNYDAVPATYAQLLREAMMPMAV